MEIWALFISASGSVVILGTSYLVLRGTILDITYPRENPWGLLWYLSLIFILLPLNVVSFLGIDNLPVLYIAKSGLELPVAGVTIMTLLLYVLSLGFALRFFGLSRRRGVVELSSHSLLLYRKAVGLCLFLGLFGLLLLASFYFLGYRHALLTSVMRGISLLRVRLANKYDSRVPSQIASILPLVGYLLAILSGYVGRHSLKYSFIYLLIALFVLAAPGDKALPVHGVILWILAHGALLPKRLFSLKTLGFAIFMVALGMVLLYAVVSQQIPQLSMEKFAAYLVNRLGVGQMAGVYETFGLIEEGHSFGNGFFWHMVPFASFFVDYVDYQKYLMMVTEGYEFTEMGVKNTYFIAEAYAIGGPVLALLSPIVVGFATALGLYLLMRAFRFAIGGSLATVAIPIYLKTHDITGGFSGFPLLKGLIFLLLQLGVLWVFWLVVSLPWQASSLLRTSASTDVLKDATKRNA